MIKLGFDNSFLEISIQERLGSHTDDYWDANWLIAKVIIQVPGFRASYVTNLRTDEFVKLSEDLTKALEGTSRGIVFTSMEDGLELKGDQKSTGAVLWTGKAWGGGGNTLEFTFETDYSSLVSLKSEVEKILNLYPVIGTPDSEK